MQRIGQKKKNRQFIFLKQSQWLRKLDYGCIWKILNSFWLKSTTNNNLLIRNGDLWDMKR